MLTSELVDALQMPISESSPCGDDLEYDADFIALASAAEGRAEQQFGDTLIPAVEPDWRAVAEQADALLRRSKDLRVAMLMLRAATRLQGLGGFVSGLDLLTALVERHWAGLHPRLDAEDGDDPTMRLNTLAPLADEGMVPKDFCDARIGVPRGLGPLRVRDVAIAHNLIAAVSGEAVHSMAQLQGALQDIAATNPEGVRAAAAVAARLQAFQTALADKVGRGDAVDLGRLRAIAGALHKACEPVLGSAAGTGEASTAMAGGGGMGAALGTPAAAAPGAIHSRDDAVQTLDRVIQYLRETEPGNPAPLLIERAKQLIGVGFLEIMANLAPNALDSIESVIGKRAAD